MLNVTDFPSDQYGYCRSLTEPTMRALNNASVSLDACAALKEHFEFCLAKLAVVTEECKAFVEAQKPAKAPVPAKKSR